MNPPFRCLFCLRTDVAFTRVEHPIPESLGNDDWVLPAGYVCDRCNQYFGSKVENRVISGPPFILERMGYAVKSKKGRLPTCEIQPHLHMVATGYTDTAYLVAEWGYVEHSHSKLQRERFLADLPEQSATYISRFLLKIGLEALLRSPLDPYSSAFDSARAHARRGTLGDTWQVGYAIYPRRKDLEILTRYDEAGPIIRRQLYDWQLGVLPSGDVSMYFIYGQHIFACNLSRPPIVEYLVDFNRHNDVVMDFLRDPPTGRIIRTGSL